MNIKRVTFVHICLTLVLAFIFLFIFDYKVLLGIILGSGLGYFNLFILNRRVSNLVDDEIPDLASIVKKNRNFRYLIILLVLLISGFLPMVFNLIATCLSVLIIKISMYIDLLISKK